MYKMRLQLLGIIFLIPYSTIGQLPYYNLSSEGNGRADINSVAEGTSTLFTNPAGLASVDKFSIFLMGQNIAGFDGIQTSGIGLIIPSHAGSFSISGIYYGDHLYNCRKLSVGWAQKLGIAQLGIQAGWGSSYLKGTGSSNSLLIDFSGIAEITPELKVGAGIFNLLTADYFHEDRIPVIVRSGIDYHPLRACHLSVEVEKDLESDPNYKVGISYLLRKHLYFSTGIKLKPVSHSFGFGVELQKLVIHTALVNLPGLGTLQSISISLIPGSRNNE